MNYEIDIAIVGAGVIGLAIAAELGALKRNVFVFERNAAYGQEISSRNSEVLHAGIYYPENSLKTKLCLEGKRRIYELCQEHRIPYNKTGKIILASDDSEISKLESVCSQAAKNGVQDIQFLSESDIRNLEPRVTGKAGILSPSSGILDTHSLMKYYYGQAIQNGVDFLFGAEVIDMDKTSDKWNIVISDSEGRSEVSASIVINCAGLDSGKIAELAGIRREDYRLYFCKGSYFSLAPKWRKTVSHLVYPIPEAAGLGVHLTPSIDGILRLGPDATYVKAIDYKTEKIKKTDFFHSAKKFMPTLNAEDLIPDFSGIRPKLQGPHDTFRDFVISHEVDSGCEGLINLIGMESPGITASPAIASYVTRIVVDIN